MKYIIFAGISLGLIGLAVFGGLTYSSYKNFNHRAQSSIQPQSVSNTNKVIVTYPSPNSVVTSPLVLQGKVATRWMFEGSFPVKILDSKRKLIAQGQATETDPGSWTTDKEIAFTSEIYFSTNDRNGYILLEKDNPSGLPENADSYEFPVKFDASTKYACPPDNRADCMPIVTPKKQKYCTADFLKWARNNCPNFEVTM